VNTFQLGKLGVKIHELIIAAAEDGEYEPADVCDFICQHLRAVIKVIKRSTELDQHADRELKKMMAAEAKRKDASG
jgi:hypothetical protein